MTYYLPEGQLNDTTNGLYKVRTQYINSLGYTLSILTINKKLYYRLKKIKKLEINIELDKSIKLIDSIIENLESVEDYLDRLIEMDSMP